jgi:predicted homoserine dehydrogenase-like protein
MYGPRVPVCTPIRKAGDWYNFFDLIEGPGIVDYVVGADPAPGVFVIGIMGDETQRAYLEYYKMGKGPFYVFYVPYHLCHFEVPNSIARAVLFQDATLAPLGAPMVDVVTTAKINLKAGQVLDGIGQYMTYGQCENADITSKQQLLPVGLSEGCCLQRDIPKDQVLTYDDIILPTGRLSDKLREEQNVRWH